MEDKKHNLITNRTSGGGVSTLEFYSKQKSKTHRAVIALIFIIVAVIFLLQFETFNTTKITELSVGEQLSVKKSNPNSKSEKSIKASAGIFVPSCPKLQQIQDTISSTKKRIWKDWDVSNYPLFLSIIQIPETSWNIQKAKFVKLLLSQEILPGQDGEVNSLENQLKSQSFVVGFSGSSVTAGHDNFFFEAYPNVFYETMLPVFNSLGNIELVVRNHALGNNPCYPYDACMETHMGDDLDILTWEQSMNCGRQPNQIDTFARSAYRMPKKPTILFLESVNPHWSDKECDKLNFISATPRLPLTANEQAILTTDIKTLATRKNMVMSNMKYLNDEQARESLANRFARLAPMGQDLNAMGVYKCYGPYTAQFSAKTLGGGGGWHPGKLTHQYRGDNLAFFMLSILEDAVSSIQQGRECIGGSAAGDKNNNTVTNSSKNKNNTVTNSSKNKNKRMLRSVGSNAHSNDINDQYQQLKQKQQELKQQQKQKQHNRELKGKLSKITGTSAGTVTTSSSIIDPTASSDRISAIKKSEHKAEIHNEHNEHDNEHKEHSSEHHVKQSIVISTSSPTVTTVTTPVSTTAGTKLSEPVPSSNKINNNNNNNNNKNDNKMIENNSGTKQSSNNSSLTIAHGNGHLSKVSGISAGSVTVTSGNKIVHSSNHHIDANGNENINRTEQSVPKPVNTGKLSVLTGTSAGSVSVTSGNKLLNTTAFHSNTASNIHHENVAGSSGGSNSGSGGSSVSSSTTNPEHKQEMTHNHGKLSHITGTSAATVTTGAALTEPLQHAPTNNDHHNDHNHNSNSVNNVHNSINNHANSEVKPATPQVTTATPASSVTQAQATPATVHHHQATTQSEGKLTVSGTSAGTVTTGSALLNPKQRQLSNYNSNNNSSDNNSTNKNINNDSNSSNISNINNNKRKSALDLIENRTYSTATGYIDNALDNNYRNSASSIKLDPNMIRHINAVAQARTQMKKNSETLKQHESKLISTAKNMTNLINKSKQSLLLLNAQKQQENSLKNKPTSAENILKYPVSTPKTRFLSEESPVLSVDNEDTSFVSSIFQFFSSIFGGSSDVKRLNALEQIKYFKKLTISEHDGSGDNSNSISNSDTININANSLDKLIYQTINDTTLLNEFVTAFKTGKYNTIAEKNTLVSLIQLEYSNYYLKEAQKVPLPPVPVHYKTNEINKPQSCYTNFEPRIGNSLTSQVINKHTNWNLSLSFFDINGVAHSILKQFNYIDRKYIFVSTGIHSQIALHIRTKSENPVWICENQKGMMKYPDYMGDLNVAADAYIMLNYKQYETNSNNNNNNNINNNNNMNNINNNNNNINSSNRNSNQSSKNIGKHHRRLKEQHNKHTAHHNNNNNNHNRKLQSALDILNGVKSDTPTTITAISTAAEQDTTKPSQSTPETAIARPAASTTAMTTPAVAIATTTTTAATTVTNEVNEDPKLAKSRLFVGDTGSMRAIDIINGKIGTPTVQATVRPRAVRTSRSNYTRNSIKNNTSSTASASHKDTKTKLPLKTTTTITAATATSHERIAFRKKTDSTDNVQPHSTSTTTATTNKAAVLGSTPVDKFTTIAIEKFSHPKRLPLVPPSVISFTDADSHTKTIELSAPIEFNSEVFVPLDLSDTTKFKKLEINEFQSQCYRTSNVPPGEHMLVLVQKDKQQQVNIGYLITW